MCFAKRNNNVGMATKLALYHYTGNQIFYRFVFFLEYDQLRDLTGALDVCIKKLTHATFHLLS